MTTTQLDLEAIRVRVAAATPGPWWDDSDDNCWRLHGVHARIPVDPIGIPEQVINHQIIKAPKRNTPYAEYWPNDADAAFICHARQDVPALLGEVERLRDELATVSRRVRHIAEHGDPHTAKALALIAAEAAEAARTDTEGVRCPVVADTCPGDANGVQCTRPCLAADEPA